MTNILITGGLGFIGFNAVQLWTKIRPDLHLVVVDLETYAASFKLEEKLQWLKDHGISYYKCDICDEFSVDALVQQNNIDTIINFAAESHVDNSINGPDVFFNTNVIGTVKLLNVARKHKLRFHQVSTDEVYGETSPDSWENTDEVRYIDEYIPADVKPLKPSSPYSASKAAADMAVLSYVRTFNVNATVSRCTNNFGKWQHPEKLIGTVIKAAMAGKSIPVYGKGNQMRHWINVDEHNRIILEILSKGIAGKIYNIAPPEANWITNIKLIRFILKQLGKPTSLITHVTDRPGHDISYFLVGTDFCQSKKKWKEDMAKTVEWYQENL